LCAIHSQPESYVVSGDLEPCFLEGHPLALFITAGSKTPGGRVDGILEYCQLISFVSSFIPRIVVIAFGSPDGFNWDVAASLEAPIGVLEPVILSASVV